MDRERKGRRGWKETRQRGEDEIERIGREREVDRNIAEKKRKRGREIAKGEAPEAQAKERKKKQEMQSDTHKERESTNHNPGEHAVCVQLLQLGQDSLRLRNLLWRHKQKPDRFLRPQFSV